MIKFGTDGWRAIISDEFTFDNVAKVAQAIATYLKSDLKTNKPVIIGYDARFLADAFAILCAKVLKANGINCLVTESDTPTPVVAFEVKDKKAAGAIMLTASHNPPEYCGIKFIADYGGPVFEDVTKKIEKYIAEQDDKKIAVVKKSTGEVERFNPKQRYLKYIEQFIDVDLIKKAGLKVVYDPMFGSGRGYLDELLDAIGVNVTAINNYRDVLFGGSNPEPDGKRLKDLAVEVVKHNANLGLANDGDADRFGVVDEQGEFLNANQVVSLVAYYLLKERRMKGTLVRSVATTHMLDAIAGKFKTKCIETPVGFKYIAKEMLKGKVLIGGEESGGLSILGHIPEKDGILAGLLMVEMVAKLKMPLSEIYQKMVEEIGPFYQDKINLHVDDSKKNKIVNALKESPPKEVCGQNVEKVNTLDGVKVILKDGSWFLIRPSGTEPLMRVYLEAESPKVIAQLKGFVENIIKAA
ncbi:MAG: phosphoglucomutase/phosphomannomutase family protein [Candidatus Margulisbacteria bacterium]|nr:phosphoglucomutase/phosphomannomutase family protein [Candidatus Margulisiibacteriota bacterium]MBU1021434.1 phosphoglucomutase/phosphomannomutase family protein [Candidatus Margulisiibacteriota bacterium]MBU1728355.1 phosphoglucomutase/phosphomannomutase family protein [Candidatus Margulisiibacteriota bacterium]MBU1955902.1 phosphoglucomutase/phosphomannomutase family protein [Candidatus Margulisiibacteriota bacterium]